MRCNTPDSWNNLIAELGASAAELDCTGAFPRDAFARLIHHGLIGSPPLEDVHIGTLLRLLATIGRGDLSVGRIYEGHVNALWLIRTYGTTTQRKFYEGQARENALFGVWNTDMPDAPLHLEDGVLQGAKNFASGIEGLNYALVTVPLTDGRQIIIVPVERVRVDRSWWNPMGMRASGSHIAGFDGIVIEPEWLLGKPDAYISEPWFSGGAIRFAAVQTGGMHAIFDIAVAHLQRTGRSSDPYQRHRIARMGIAVETAYGWLERASNAWRKASQDCAGSYGQKLPIVACATRAAIEKEAMNLLADAERAVGAAGFIAPHPLERRIRDMRTYLRQPNPDGALSAVGAAIAEGRWLPGEKQ